MSAAPKQFSQENAWKPLAKLHLLPLKITFLLSNLEAAITALAVLLPSESESWKCFSLASKLLARCEKWGFSVSSSSVIGENIKQKVWPEGNLTLLWTWLFSILIFSFEIMLSPTLFLFFSVYSSFSVVVVRLFLRSLVTLSQWDAKASISSVYGETCLQVNEDDL